jgi:nucleoside-diphosphate-sugar epimerase
MLTPPKLRELRHTNWVTDNSRIAELTGWAPNIGLAEGLQMLKNPTD